MMHHSQDTQPWYMDWGSYRFMLEEGALSKEEYLSAIAAVHRIVPFAEAEQRTKRLMKENGGQLGGTWLHPTPWHHTIRNPLPQLLSSRWMSRDGLIDIVRLGRDLIATDQIKGIVRVRNRLKLDTDYVSALFEIEVLAEFVRACLPPELLGAPDCCVKVDQSPVYVEIKHKGVPFGLAVYGEFHLAGVEFGEFEIQLNPTSGGSGERHSELASRVRSHCLRIIESQPCAPVQEEAAGYRVKYDPTKGPRSVSFSFGPGPPQSIYEILGEGVAAAVEDKERQLRGLGGMRLVALDLRSFSVSRSNEAAVSPKFYQPVRPAITNAVQVFLRKSSIIHGVLVWWRRASVWDSTFDRLHKQNEIALITTDAEIPLTDSTGLVDLMRQSTQSHAFTDFPAH